MAGHTISLFREYGYEKHPLGNLDNYMRSIEEASKHHRASDLERDMAGLTMFALDLQRPYIKSGWFDLNKFRN